MHLGDIRKPCWTLRILTVVTLLAHGLTTDDGRGWKQVKGLKGAMYAEMKYSRACIKLLTASGPQGCEAPRQKLVTAPLVHSKDLGVHFKGQRVVVVPAREADQFLSRLLSEPELRSQVAGVLVDPTAGRPARHSTAAKFPSAAYAPYDNASYVWNPSGTGFTRQYFGVPMYMLTPELANETAYRASYNADNEFKGGRHVARMELSMQAEGDSLSCIVDQTCLPVGGYGVWTSVPPLPDPTYSAAPPRPVTLLVAHMDSNAIFHDLARGAATSISGLISALVALTLLVRYDNTSSYTRQLAFVALPGEGFDYMGSKRLLLEMHQGSKFVQGLRQDLIDQVLEVGQIAAAFDGGANSSTFFLHAQDLTRAADLVARVQQAAAEQADADADAASPRTVVAQAASPSNPGIPPSSLMSFLRANSSVAGLLLADFDGAFRGAYFQSEFDDGASVTPAMMQSIVDTALLLARTLHSLAAPTGSAAPPLNRTVAVALARALGECLLLDEPGMRCWLAGQIMSPDIIVFYDDTTSAAVSAYPGVLSWVMADPRSSRYKPNLSRFLFNYLGNLTAVPLGDATNTSTGEGSACDPSVNICPPPYACIGWRYGTKDPVGMGRCRNTTTNYFPAYSTRLVYGQVGRWWRWSVDSNASVAAWEAAGGWPNDSVWTESNWPALTPTLTVFQEESERTQVATLVAGLLLTAATAAVSWAGIRAFERHHKVQ